MKEIFWADSEEEKQKIVEWAAETKKLGLERLDIYSDIHNMEGITIEVAVHKDKGYFDITHYILKKDERIFADIWRNYTSYPHNLFKHSNGKLYFCCGFNYQGYTIVNCNDEVVNHYLPHSAFKGWGWCPTEWKDYDSESNEISVEGCYWGGGYDVRTYDFSNPDILPLRLIRECDADTGEEYDDDEEEGEE